jgi:hypothetical protein
MKELLTQAHLEVLGSWLTIFVVVRGWGGWVRVLGGRLSGTSALRSEPSANLLLSGFWLGLAAVLLFLQVWHLLLAVNHRAFAVVVGLGLIGLVAEGRASWTPLWRGLRSPGCWIGAFVWLAVVIWIANESLASPRHGDSGAYFLPTVRWYQSQAVLPGLGLVYPLFAYNQSYFLWVSLLDFGWLVDRTTHFANSVLLIVLWTRVILGVGRLVGRRPAATSDVFYACLSPAVAWLGQDILLTSPGPDFAVWIFGIAMFAPLFRDGREAHESREGVRRLLSVALLAAAGATLKLSLVALGIGTSLLAFVWWVREGRVRQEAPRVLVLVFALALFSIGVWIVRNLIQSGSPFFPSTFGALDVDWRVERDVAAWIQQIIRPFDFRAAWSQPQWAVRTLTGRGWSDPPVLGPLGAAALCLSVAPFLRLVLRRPLAAPGASWWMLVVPGSAMLFGLAIAAAARFAGATPWLIGAQAVLLCFGFLLTGPGRIARLGLCLLLLIGGYALWDREASAWRSQGGFPRRSIPPFEVRTLQSGLEIKVPLSGRTCGNTPPPCTTEPDVRLAPRRAGDPSAGFRLLPVVPSVADG